MSIDNESLATENVAVETVVLSEATGTTVAATADSTPAPTEAPDGAAPANPAAEEPKWFKQRIKQITRQRGEAERRALRLEAEVEALKKAIPTSGKSAELRQEDFPNYDAYQRAVARQEGRAGALEVVEASTKTLTEREAQQAVNANYETFIEKAAEEAEAADVDMDAVLETLAAAPLLSQTIVEALAESDHPARLAEYLAENPDELARVSRLGPALAKRALAKAEAAFSAGKTPKPNATNAPAPPPKVGGRSVNQQDWRKSDNMDEYASNWAKEQEARAARR